MSLRWKLAIALAGLAGVIGALAATGSYLTASRELHRSIDDALLAQVDGLAGRNGDRDDPRRPALGTGCVAGPELRFLVTAQHVDADGQVDACEGLPTISLDDGDLELAAGESTGDLLTPARGSAYRLRDDTVDGEPVRVITATLPRSGAVMLARSTSEADEVLDNLRTRLAVIGLAGIALAAAAGVLLALRIVRPIRRLTDAAHHVAETRDLTVAVPAGGADEIGSLATSFTSMMTSLSQSLDQQQRLITDASHELRTPLTSLRTNLELLQRADRPGSPGLSTDDRAAVLDDLRFEADELTMLVTELVELATDRAAADAPTEPVDLAEVCRSVADRAERRTGRTVVVHVEGAGPHAVAGRAQLLERAVSNLVDNAVKYSPPPGPVEVTVAADAAAAIVSVRVRDHGTGIAEADLPRVFDRFYRATTARTQPGSGLGLAIVAQAATGHGGTVVAGNDPAGGAVVGFDLPALA